ncbi:hypothetical protein [Campylobacter hyointestinalis]|uniref:hypothetical protein n=1 Tax=Campylobacter hyointestinalis TaxID=198 RepID=UPI00072AE979|nr:hypothetical protein [Campylobacter hyointestinalis]CUU74297.1 putative prophage MuSo1%2C F protein [Campylobacter hyointestinalis subsp. hyointestinalis]
MQVLTKSEIERKWLTPLADSSMLKNVSGKEFAYNPGKFNKIEQIYEQKIGKFSKADSATSKIFVNNVLAKTKDFNHQRDLYVWQRGLNSMIDNISSGNIIKDKNLQIAQIGRIKDSIFAQVKKFKPSISSKNISIYQNTIWHILRDTKPNIKKPNIMELKSIVNVLYFAKHCYFDRVHNNIIYYFLSSQKDEMINDIAVDLEHTVKKFKTDNFVVSVGKIPYKNYKSTLKKLDENRNSIYIKVR